jgi:hypothetical protein
LGSTRCRNPKRVPHSSPSGLAGWIDEDERRLIETLRRRRRHASVAGEARERRSGEIPVKAFASGPGRAKPKGATSGRRTKHASGRQGLSEGSKPRSCGLSSRPPHLVCVGIPTSKRHVGSAEPETAGYLSKGEGSEGQIPGALPVRNKTGTASKGVNRQEGNQTPKAERGG